MSRNVKSCPHMLLSEQKSIKFVAFVTSPFHLIGVRAFLNKSSLNPAEGVVFVNTSPEGRYLLSDDDIKSQGFVNVSRFDTYCHFNFKQFFIRFLLFFRLNMDRKKHPEDTLYVISPRDLPLKLLPYLVLLNRPVTFVLVDEGIGTYTSLFLRFRYRILEQKSLIPAVLGLIADVVRILLLILFNVSAFNVVRFFVFSCSAINCSKLLPRGSVIPYYKHAIGSIECSIELRKRKFPKGKGVILVTQPFVETGQVGCEHYLKTIREILGILLGSYQFVLLKPHPREDLKKYIDLVGDNESKVYLLQNFKCPAEYLAFKFRYDIAGFTSTSLVSSSLFFSTNSLSFVRFIRFKRDKGAAEERFLKQFHDFVRVM